MFDPYHKWLGIPKDQRPPTYYQLLGLSPDEQDTEVIEEAAIRQTTHVRAYQIGQHGTECTQLQKEIATARLTLVNPAKRKTYDEKLAQAGKGQAAPTSATEATGEAGLKAGAPQRGETTPYEAEVLGEPREDADQTLRTQKHPEKVKKSGLPIGLFIGLGAGAVVLLLVVIVAGAGIWFLRSDAPPKIAGNPIVANKARDGMQPIRDGAEVKKDKDKENPDKIGVVPKQDNAKKNDDGKIKKPDPEPEPKKEPVLTFKGRIAPELVLDLPSDAGANPLLTTDGLRLAYGARNQGVLCYRDAPAFDVEYKVTVPGVMTILEPAASSPDGKKMALLLQTQKADDAGVVLWDWNKLAVAGSFPTAGRAMQVALAPDMQHLAAFSIKFFNVGQPDFWVQLYRLGPEKPAEIKRWKLDAHLTFFGFTPDSGTFFFGQQKEQPPRTHSLKTGAAGEMPFPNPRGRHSFAADFERYACIQNSLQIQVGSVEPLRPVTTIRRPDDRSILEVTAMSPDHRFLLIGTHVGKLEESQGQVALLDVKDAQDAEVVSVAGPLPGAPYKLQLAANGVALVQRHNNLPWRLYRFPTGPGDKFVRNDPPRKDNPLTKEVPVIKDNPPVKAVRVAVPEADKVLESEKTIREQFKKEYVKKAPGDVFALAEKLHKLAGETTDDPVACYVLLREARDLAVKAGRAELAMKAVTDMGAKYEMDELAQRVDTLLSFAKVTFNADGYKQFVEIALSHAASAMMDDRFDESSKVMGAAEAVARRSGITALLTQVLKQDKQIKEVARDHADMKAAQAKLTEDAKDAQASLTVGLYLAFRKGNWEQGLPLLAQGNNAELQDLAKKDLGVADDDKARVEVGNGWWTGADKKPAFHKAAMQWRAAYWYRQALPSLKGLTEASVGERIKQVDAQPAPFRVATGAGEVDRFKGHAGAVHFVNLSTDGKRLFSCGADGTLRSWELATGKSRVLVGPPLSKGPLIGFAMSPDERQVVLLKPGNKMFEVDLATLKPAFGGLERDAVPGMYWSSNTRVNYHFKTSLHIWHPTERSASSEGVLVFTNPPLTGNVRAVALSPQQDMAAALMSGEKAVAFRLPINGFESTQAIIHFDATAAAFPKDAEVLVLGGKEGDLRAYSMKVKANDGAKEISTFKGHSGTIRALACTPDGKTMVSGGDDRTLRVWDIASGTELRRFPHLGAVTSLVITPDGRYAISACADAMIRVWSLPK